MWTSLLLLVLVLGTAWCAHAATFEEVPSLDGEIPPLRGHTAVQYNDTLYFFGGYRINTLSGDIYIFSPANSTWTHLERDPIDSPEPRAWHGAVVYDGYMYIWGGFGLQRYNDMWRYHFDTNTWTEIAQLGNVPAVRHGFIFRVNDQDVGTAYLYGGVSSLNTFLDEFYSFDLASNTWTQLGSHPEGKGFSSGDFLTGCLFVYGGQTGADVTDFTYSDTLHSFCPGGTAVWNFLNGTGDDPVERSNHRMVKQADRVFLIGGKNLAQAQGMESAREYDPVLNTWYTPSYTTVGTFTPRFDFAMISWNGTLWLHGGLQFVAIAELWKNDYARPECPAGQHSPAGTTACSDCAPGFFTDAPGAYQCTECQNGEYTNGQGQTSCNLCPPGTWLGSAGGAVGDCIPCNAGSASDENGRTTACDLCPAGFYSDSPGETDCAECPPGTERGTPGASALAMCTDCLPGFISLGAAPSCDPCPSGQFTPGGQSICQNCTAGTYSDSPAGSCEDCPEGTFSTEPRGEGVGSCTSCPAGTFQVSAGSTSCTNCTAGTAMNPALSQQTSDVNCVACTPGFFEPDSGSTGCSQCDQGSYQNQPGQTSCSLCPEGTYNPSFGSININACLNCPSGTFGGSEGLKDVTECNNCGAGTWGGTGVSDCIPCIPGTYSTAIAATTLDVCQRCLAGTYSGEGQDQCTPCAANSYSQMGYDQCVPCSLDQADAATNYRGWILNGDMEYEDFTDGATTALERWSFTGTPYTINTGNPTNYAMQMTAPDSSTQFNAYQELTIEESNAINVRLSVRSFVQNPGLSGVGGSTRYEAVWSWRNNTKNLDTGEVISTNDVVHTMVFSQVPNTWHTMTHDIVMTSGDIEHIRVDLIFENAQGTVLWDEVTAVANPEIQCNCTDGYYYEVKRRGTCHWCEQGSYCMDSGRYPCTGDLFSFGGATACRTCIPGWRCVNGIGTPCKSNEYLDGATCSPCPMEGACADGVLTLCTNGTYGTGSRHCSLCVPSTYSDDPNGVTLCTTCSDGGSSFYRRDFCFSCAPGTYSVGGVACRSCPPGQFTDAFGETFCRNCPANTYGPESGAKGCILCPIGTTSPQGSTSLAQCT